MEANNQIQLIQKPVIKHVLAEIGATVSKRIADLNLEVQVATEDTVKSLKTLRAELNKELTEFEAQRKAIKEGVLNPYNEFEGIYKDEIATKYKAAIDTLKDKIAEVENKIKSEKKVKVESYFTELCTAEKIDFIRFDQLGLDINLSTSLKEYKEKANEFITKVLDDLALINSSEYQAETLTEYKVSLNASKAITSVRDRKEKEKQEAERIRVAEIERRKRILIGMQFAYVGITDSFDFDADIFMTGDDLVNLPKENFSTRVATFEAQIAEKKRAAQKAVEAPFVKESAPVTPPAPVTAPTVVTDEPILTASFEVRGTRAQLLALGQYMRTNSLTYKNI